MNEEQILDEEQGVSIKDIFSWVWAKKWIGLISALVIFIIVLLVIVVFYNPSAKSYKVVFSYEHVPNLEEGRYLDGSAFSYRDVISEAAVNQVVEENKEKYGSIKVDDLFKGNEFNITSSYTYQNPEAEDFTIIATDYTIEMPFDVFDSADLAKDFVIDLIKLPIKKTAELIKDLEYTVNLDRYTQTISFEDRIYYINAQIELLNTGYENFIKTNDDIFVNVDGGKSKLSQLKYEINDYLNYQNYSVMASELKLNGYIRDAELEKSKYAIQMQDLKEKLEYLLVQKDALEQRYADIRNLLANTGESSSVTIITSEAVTVLVTRLADVDAEINANKEEQRILQKKLDMLAATDKTACEDFGKRLDAVHKKLYEFTDTYTVVARALTERNMVIYYDNSNVITTNGGISLILSVLVSAIGGLLVGAVIAGICGYLYKNREPKETVEPTEQQ